MNGYKEFTAEQMTEHLSYYLMDSWSYSKVACFARNEKAFEKEYIYAERGRRSASSIAGNAYHKALQHFFDELGARRPVPTLIDLQQVAFIYIDEVPANDWKLQKTTPTIDEAKTEATKRVNAALQNFCAESSIYTEDIAEVLGVESRIEDWLVVNGVDIPLPCHMEIDLIANTTDGRTVIIDHKLVSSYSDEKEIALVRGKQAITYVLGYEESHPGTIVNEVWFIENKTSSNKDKSPQLRKFAIEMDLNARRLHEALLYEPLRRMIEAVSNPDYIYTVNDSDNLSDKAELYEFWMRTLIAEVDDFDIPEGKKSLIAHRQRKIKDSSLATINPKIITSFRDKAAAFITFDYSMTDMTNSARIEHLLRTFSIQVKVAHEIEGFSSDTYLLECGAGFKLANIFKYRMDIANALNVPSVRIASTLVPYEGKTYLSIEANKKRTETLAWGKKYLSDNRIPIGLDNFRNAVVWDLDNHSTPHMLICGATGSGKSVSVRSTIEYARAAGITDIRVIDPKNEFIGVRCAERHSDIEDIEAAMKRYVDEMQLRAKTGKSDKVLIIIDEVADAISMSRKGKALDIRETDFLTGKSHVVGRERSLEENLQMLLQKGRSLGYRVIAATQRASTKIINGDAKVNFPVQVCFRVPKAVDSKVVLDEEGAEGLAGLGDGLMRSPEYLDMVRFQGFYYK